MPIIGHFIPAKDSGWIGVIRTLTIDAKLRFVPNDDRHATNTPTFQIFAGPSRIGHAWEARTSSEASKMYFYFSVKFYDQTIAEPISAGLFPAEDGTSAQLVWSRRPTRDL